MAFWPVAVLACSPSSPTPPQMELTSGSSGSTSGHEAGSSGPASGSQAGASGAASGNQGWSVSGGAGGSGNASGSGSPSGTSGAVSGNTGSGGGTSGGPLFADAGSGGSEASVDAAPRDDGGSSDGGGACPPARFSEDFEQGQGQLDPTKWVLTTGGNAAQEIQQQTVAHGTYAWHVHSTGARGEFATILTKSVAAALQGSGPVFGRASFYATANTNPHVQLGFAGTTREPTVRPAITSNGMNFNYMEFAEFGSGTWQLGFDLFTPAPSVASGFVEEASYTHPTMRAPVMKWSCIEWEFNDNPDMLVLWIDGTQIDQLDAQHIDYTSTTRSPGNVLNGKSSGIVGGFAFFGFGFHDWGSGNAFDDYYDDIVLDTSRVGCLAAGTP